MKRRKFLAQLKKALKHDMSAAEIKENIEYYDQYIRDEVKKGESEEEVVRNLGDPWILAKTIRTQADLDEDETQTEDTKSQETHAGNRINRAKLMMYLAITFVILIAIIALVLKLFLFALRIILPIMIVLFLIKLFTRK